MMDISDLIRHLEDERRTITASLEDVDAENMTRQYFYNQGRLTVLTLTYVIKLLREMLQ